MSQLDWALLWLKHGGDPAKALEASAIVMAESGGQTKVYNGICCYGGYQFNTNTLPTKCAINPDCATQAAIRISSNGKDWSKWETHENGAYEKYLSKHVGDQITAAAIKLGISGPSGGGPAEIAGAAKDAVTAIPNGIDALAKAVAAIGNVLTEAAKLLLTPAGWLRLGKVFFGIIAVLWGMNLLLKNSTGTDVAGGARKVGEAAAAAAVLK